MSNAERNPGTGLQAIGLFLIQSGWRENQVIANRHSRAVGVDHSDLVISHPTFVIARSPSELVC
jgi:hypothetical protein